MNSTHTQPDDLPLLSIVIPAYNEEESIELLYDGLTAVIDTIERYRFEVIIVENGSHDNTYSKLLAVRNKDPRFKIVQLSRNFEAEGGIAAGLAHASGEAAIILYADLEDPPSLIPEFIAKWEEGYENVYGITMKRHGNWLRKQNAKLFYWLIHRLTGGRVPKYVADFRLIDRKIYRQLNNMNERNRFLRGMVAWTGFRSCGIKYERQQRKAGSSKAFSSLAINLALRGIFSFSDFPLKLIILFGLFLSFTSFLLFAYFCIRIIFFGIVPFDGYGTIVSLILLLFGVLFFVLGIVGQYVGMIFREVKNRPGFIVNTTHGVPSDESDHA